MARGAEIVEISAARHGSDRLSRVDGRAGRHTHYTTQTVRVGVAALPDEKNRFLREWGTCFIRRAQTERRPLREPQGHCQEHLNAGDTSSRGLLPRLAKRGTQCNHRSETAARGVLGESSARRTMAITCARARKNRAFRVPSGIPRAVAASAVVNPSNTRKRKVARRQMGSISTARSRFSRACV